MAGGIPTTTHSPPKWCILSTGSAVGQSSRDLGGDIRVSVQLVVFLLLVSPGGGILSLLRQPAPVDIEIQLPTATPIPEIKVFVNGAVHRPGVYRVDPEDRLEDVLALAGGLTQDADPSMVNPALRVSDEAHFYIPSLGEGDSRICSHTRRYQHQHRHG